MLCSQFFLKEVVQSIWLLRFLGSMTRKKRKKKRYIYIYIFGSMNNWKVGDFIRTCKCLQFINLYDVNAFFKLYKKWYPN